MPSCLEARETFSKLEGVVRAHPYGHNGRVLVFVSDKKAITEEIIEEALRSSPAGLRLRKIKRA